jgi:hypothetical protein
MITIHHNDTILECRLYDWGDTWIDFRIQKNQWLRICVENNIEISYGQKTYELHPLQIQELNKELYLLDDRIEILDLDGTYTLEESGRWKIVIK